MVFGVEIETPEDSTHDKWAQRTTDGTDSPAISLDSLIKCAQLIILFRLLHKYLEIQARNSKQLYSNFG